MMTIQNGYNTVIVPKLHFDTIKTQTHVRSNGATTIRRRYNDMATIEFSNNIEVTYLSSILIWLRLITAIEKIVKMEDP